MQCNYTALNPACDVQAQPQGLIMKQSVNFSDFVDAFRAYDRYDAFGYQALKVIFDYLEQYEEDMGEEIELDVIAICCDYNVNDAATIARDYSIDLAHLDAEDDDYEEQCEEAVLEYLNDHTMVLGQCVDGIVYQCF
jgi:hypothetical protein